MASFFGGLSHFSNGQRETIQELPLTVIHSGQSAQTGPRVKAYQTLQDRAGFAQEAQQLVVEFASHPVLALEAYGHLVEELAQKAGFVYKTAAHNRIAQLARDHGGSAKPSGAGGGDIAVALIPDEEERMAFVRSCHQEGLVEVPVSISQGLHWTSHA